MRILVVSNLYPPHYIGGYELGCYEIVQRLKKRGHHIEVLTSTYGMAAGRSDGEVHRLLQADFTTRAQSQLQHAAFLLRKEMRNQRAAGDAIKRFKPELVFIFNLTGTSVSVGNIAEDGRVPVCYWISDRWLARWESDRWYEIWTYSFRRVALRAARRMAGLMLKAARIVHARPPGFHHVYFVSEYLKRDAVAAGKSFSHAKVIHWGVDTEKFRFKKRGNCPRRLLYVGQVTEMKGVRTLIEAMLILVKEKGRADVRLTIVGGTVTPDFLTEMKEMVTGAGLEEYILFPGEIPREELTGVYDEHDILIFPSLFEEALTMTILEAMSCGLSVVSTATGGNVEVIRDRKNALVFERKDSAACAAHIIELMEDPQLFERLSREGRRTVEEGFQIEGMIDRLESSLQQALGGGRGEELFEKGEEDQSNDVLFSNHTGF
jgi:glycosyltransferase involved in cell wall biosynthesis